MDMQRSHGCVWEVVVVMGTSCLLAGFKGVSGKEKKLPYLSQFQNDVYFQSQKSEPFSGDKFQYLQVTWLRQTQGADNRTIMAGYDALDAPDPKVAWLVNGRLVHESDRTFKQEVTKSFFMPSKRDVRMASITIPHVIGVTSLQLLLILDTIETLTDINPKGLGDLDNSHSIREQDNDVALALSSQEIVTTMSNHNDVIFLTRFFSEELTDAVSETLEARYLRMLPTNPDVTLEIVTSDSNPDIMTTWEPVSEEVPSSLHKNFLSQFRRHRMVKITEDTQNVRGLVEFTASYKSGSYCRLFGGQKITRRAFVRSERDRGGYWGRGGPMTFLPFARYVPVTCRANVDVTVTALGESSPYIYLVKDGDIRESGNGVTIFLFQRLLQTEAVFRFENVSPEMSGTYLVWAENRMGRTDETSFTLVLEDDC